MTWKLHSIVETHFGWNRRIWISIKHRIDYTRYSHQFTSVSRVEVNTDGPQELSHWWLVFVELGAVYLDTIEKTFPSKWSFLVVVVEIIVKKCFLNRQVELSSFFGECTSEISDVFEIRLDLGFMAGPACCCRQNLHPEKTLFVDYVESRDFSFTQTSMTRQKLPNVIRRPVDFNARCGNRWEGVHCFSYVAFSVCQCS